MTKRRRPASSRILKRNSPMRPHRKADRAARYVGGAAIAHVIARVISRVLPF